MFNILVLLDVQANLPETSPIFVCSNGFGEHLFSNVLGMYNFEEKSNSFRKVLQKGSAESIIRFYLNFKKIKKNEVLKISRKFEAM